MKRTILVIFLLQMLVVVSVGKVVDANLQPPTQYVDQETGLLVKRDTPENIVTSYYSLFDKEGYQGAFELLTGFSQKELENSKSLEFAEKNFKMNTSRLAKVFPALVEDDIALVGFVRINRFVDKKDTAVLGVEVLIKEEKRWGIVKSRYKDMGQFKEVIELAVKYDKLLSKENYSEFNPEQVKQLMGQLVSMYGFHSQAITKINEYEKEEKNQKGKKVTTDASVYTKTYEEDDPHGYLD